MKKFCLVMTLMLAFHAVGIEILGDNPDYEDDRIVKLIQSRYENIYDRIVNQGFTEEELDRVELAINLAISLPESVGKERAGQNVAKSIEYFRRNPEKRDEDGLGAAAQRRMFFTRVQIFVEKSANIVETKYLVWRAFTGF